MVRYLVTACAAALLLTAAPTKAQAQESGSDSARIDMSSMTHEELCELVRQCQRGDGSERCREARRGAREAWRRLLARLDSLELRIELLEQGDGGRDVDAELDRLRGLIESLNVRIDELAQLMISIEEVQRRLGDLDEGQVRQDLEIQAARDRIAALEVWILRERPDHRVAQLGFGFGGIYVRSCDTTSYSGFLLGPRLSLRVHPMVDVVFDIQLALSISDNPVGLRGRGGLQVEFLDGVFILEAGVSALWVNYDPQLYVDSVFLMADIGFEYRPHPIVGLGAAYLIGDEFDQCEDCFSTGVVGTVELYLPRW